MVTFDLILAILLGGFLVYGLWVGLITVVGSLIGIIFGTLLAGRYGPKLAKSTSFLYGGNMGVANIVSFFAIFFIGEKIVGIVFWFVQKAFKLASVIPFAKTINRVAGAVLGLVEGILVLGLLLHIASGLEVTPWFDAALDESFIAPVLMWVAKIIVPLLPEALREIKEVL